MKEKQRKITRPHLSYTGRKAMYGYGFIAIWIVGFIYFFVRPFITTIVFSLNDIKFMQQGMKLTFNHFSAYKKAIMEDPTLLREMVSCFTNLVYSVPLIVILSIFIAVLLNKDFFGKTFFRAVYFIPVIVSSGVLLGIIRGDNVSSAMVEGTKSGSMLQISNIGALLSEFNLPEKVSSFLLTMSNSVFDLLWKSGIQILLFLSGIQSISPSIYEASKIEGASAWDNFWKITIPMLSPIIVLAVIYSIIDAFTDTNNAIMKRILADANILKYTEASVMATMYFTLAMLFIALVYFVLNKILPYTSQR